MIKRELVHPEKDLLLTMFYLGKLSEFDLIEGLVYKITDSGFDIAYDLYKCGYKISEEEMAICMHSLLGDTPYDIQTMICELALRLQEIGADKMKQEINEMYN